MRAPAVAGLFYPDNPDALTRAVDDALDAVELDFAPPKALIAPHAGYVYSGPVAATAYAQLAPLREAVRRVVLLGPSHRVALRGVAASAAHAFATPLGDVPVDRAAIDALADLPFVTTLEAAHAEEHALEVHLPFLQRVLADFALVPLVVGVAAPEQVGQVLARLWGGPETLVVVSSDLSHYHDYDTARDFDSGASEAMETLRGDRLDGDQACGYHPIRGLLERARALDMRVTTLDLRNSGDTAGSRDRVVGYGAYALEYAAGARLPQPWRERLLETARRTVVQGAELGHMPEVDKDGAPRPLLAARATFVTAMLDGRLRGCIGSSAPRRPLIDDVAHNAYQAVTADPRFDPVGPEEAWALDVKVSILSTPRPIACRNEKDLIEQLRPDVDGLILDAGGKRAVFLPQVWRDLSDPRRFVERLKVKAGLRPDYWSRKVEVRRFTVESF